MKRKPINDRIISPKEKPYVIEDEGGCHLVNEMFCGTDDSFEVGDRVIVTDKFTLIPELADKEGFVYEIIIQEQLNRTIYVVQFDKPFRGRRTMWAFLLEDEYLCKSI